ncbi:MAG: hypothetical protein GVY07_12135 [Bacteroidetes bacterium]|jgi:hypothetical protein|nr:hypothetical protein [Bacteroidota bacterium]
MKKQLTLFASTILCSILLNIGTAAAQNLNASMFRLAEGFVRIAEPGQLADTLNVWGDVNAPGRYIVPRGTTAHELISYARGPVQSTGNVRQLDWSKLRVEVTISRPSMSGDDTAQSYEFRYSEPLPGDLRDIELGNDYLVSLEIKRKPAFVDWLRVVSSVVGTTATAIIIIDRISE